jgi:hypothetical protein
LVFMSLFCFLLSAKDFKIKFLKIPLIPKSSSKSLQRKVKKRKRPVAGTKRTRRNQSAPNTNQLRNSSSILSKRISKWIKWNSNLTKLQKFSVTFLKL